MAKDKAAKEGSGKDGKDKKGKSSLLPAVIIAVGLLGAGYFVGGKGGGGGAPAQAHETAAEKTTTTEAHPEGEVIKLEAITLNLADGRFLKVGLALQLAEGASAEKLEGHAPVALDEAISLLGDRTYAQLSAPGGRAQAKKELTERVEKRFAGKVVDVYFTEFVMQ